MNDSRKVKVGLVQMQCGADPAPNVDKALELVRAAAKKGAQIICLPELFRSRYFCQTEDAGLYDLAESIPGPTSDIFAGLAAELDVSIIASLFERRAPGLYHNTVAVLDGKHGLAGIYRKMHIPDDPRYYEKYYFTPGDLGFKAFAVRNATIGTLICWDQWYPENARIAALLGAEVLFYPTAIGWRPEEKENFGEQHREGWRTIQRSHAIANELYVAAVNRTGHEPEPGTGGIDFFGSSFVADPFGTVVAEAPAHEETVLVHTCDRTIIESVRRHWPFFRDRRVDAFAPLTKRWLADA